LNPPSLYTAKYCAKEKDKKTTNVNFMILSNTTKESY